MALINRPTQVHQQLPKFFNTLREGTAPDKFTQQYLVDIGFGSSNYRVLIPLLKDLGFLTADGSPTERYKSYLDSSRSRTVLGEAVKEAYSDLFTITKNPTKSDREKISGKFKSTFNLSDLQAERCANTFLALTELSDLNATSTSPQQQASNDIPLPTNTKEAESSNGRVIGLKYDIAIHLPATKDIEVYNAIFKSLKEHLVD
ncbi:MULTISPECIES: DUF5343 domain-containing protein [Bacteria]|jgi:Family of unknown function (DUF5343)|uniref:DUF5343 domain-containing protein n=1 Tax=Umezakia ovalisporum FSS-43 TaxID=2740520 RepID=A0ABT6K3K6_9CYAN|nr:MULTISPECIES: DUF5343 domain-containing protein [Bacteria]MDH6056883.1 DUF5343 domain-containing protein [Umezakia ovalisporum FSS-43]